MGTERTTKWVSEWKRNSNLPSPEEAVYICVLLQTTPEEILLHEGETEEETAKCQKDIALVRDLLDQQGAKKRPLKPVSANLYHLMKIGKSRLKTGR